MFLVCPSCLAARPKPQRAVGFKCDACGHAWEAPHRALAKAYYAEARELDISLTADDGSRFRITSMPAVIGRDSDFAVLASNLSVSRRHCSLDFDVATNSFIVKDLGGKGGTVVGGRALAADECAQIAPGEELRVSGVRLHLDIRLRTDAVDDKGATPKIAAEKPIDLTRCPSLALIGLKNDGGVGIIPGSDGALGAQAALIRSNDAAQWRILVLRREAVRVNGEIAIERVLMASDQIVFAGRCFTFNHAAGALEPELPGAGPSISIAGLRVSYGANCVLSDIRLTIPGGRLTAILGESGCGKTTLLKVLSGLRAADRAEITVGPGLGSQADYGVWAREHGALVPQHDVVQGELTVRQCLRYAASLRLGPRVGAAAKRDRIEKALHDTGLTDQADRRIAELSGGQRKRVNVAVELIGTPDVLFLDEPTSGLDYATERTIIAGLRALSRRGKTVAFVTHSLATIDAADHLVVLQPGSDGATVLTEGTPTTVKTRLHASEWGEVIDQAARTIGAQRTGTLRRMSTRFDAFRARFPRALVLLARYVHTWLSNPAASTAVLVGLPLLLGILIRLAVSDGGRIGTDRLLFGLIASFWLGMNQSVREIVREKAIFIQEQSNRASCAAYLASKIIFFGIAAVPQALLLSAPLKWVSVMEQGVTLSDDELHCPWSLILIMFWVAGVLGCLLGLLASSLCLFLRQKGEVVAVLLVILVTLPQFLFSEKVLPGGLAREAEHFYTFTRWHAEQPIPEFLSFFTISRYLFLPLDAVSRDVSVAPKAFLFNGTILAMVGLVTLTLTWIALEMYVVWQRRL